MKTTAATFRIAFTLATVLFVGCGADDNSPDGLGRGGSTGAAGSPAAGTGGKTGTGGAVGGSIGSAGAGGSAVVGTGGSSSAGAGGSVVVGTGGAAGSAGAGGRGGSVGTGGAAGKPSGSACDVSSACASGLCCFSGGVGTLCVAGRSACDQGGGVTLTPSSRPETGIDVPCRSPADCGPTLTADGAVLKCSGYVAPKRGTPETLGYCVR